MAIVGYVGDNIYEKIKLCNSIERHPWWFSGKESAYQCRRHGFDLWVRKIPGEGNGYPLQFSCLQHSMDRGAWRDTIHGVAKESDMT